MTPGECIARIGEMIGDGQDELALVFASKHSAAVLPVMNADEIDIAAALLSSAERYAWLAGAERARRWRTPFGERR